MAATKLQKALYGPSLTEVAFGALLGLLVGVVVACVYLVFKPVLTVKEMPKEPASNVVYFLLGADSNAKSKTWQAKQKQFLTGGRVQLVEDELNAWAATLGGAAPGEAAKAAKPGDQAGQPAPTGFVIPAKPNFRLVDGKIQIGMQCTLNWFGLMTDVTVQATGVLSKEGDVFAFVPETVFLGSCPLHFLPLLSTRFVSLISDNEKVPDEVRAAWAKLTEARIEGSTLKLAGR